MAIDVDRLQVGGYTAQKDRNSQTALLFKTAAVTAKAGIIPSDGTDFGVSAQGTPNMTLNVTKGQLVIPDAAGGAYVFTADATTVVTIATAPSSGTRYDLVIARVYDNSAGDSQATSNITLPGSAGTFAVQTITGTIEVVTGTSGGSPSPPSLPNARCVVLKVVAVGTNVTSINNGNLQDSQSTTSRVGFTTTAGGVLSCTTATRPSTPHDGQMIWETDTNQVHIYDLATTTWLLVYEDTGYTTPTLGSSWAAFGGAFVAPRYCRVNGFTELDGEMASGTTGAVFTLPAGYRPGTSKVFAPASGNGIAIITITTAGVVSVTTLVGGSNTSVSLAGIRFRSEA